MVTEIVRYSNKIKQYQFRLKKQRQKPNIWFHGKWHFLINNEGALRPFFVFNSHPVLTSYEPVNGNENIHKLQKGEYKRII